MYEQIDVSQPSLSRRQVNALLEPVEDLEMIVVTSLKTKMSFNKGAISNGKDRLPTTIFAGDMLLFANYNDLFPPVGHLTWWMIGSKTFPKISEQFRFGILEKNCPDSWMRIGPKPPRHLFTQESWSLWDRIIIKTLENGR